MPTNRTRRTRKVATVTLDSLGFRELHRFIRGWRPPLPGFDHPQPGDWLTWRSYFAAYEQVRTELLDLIAEDDGSLLAVRLARLEPGNVPFAERIEAEIAEAGADGTYDCHRHGGSQHSHVYVRDDAHVHEEWRVNPPLRLPSGKLWHGVIWPAVEVRDGERGKGENMVVQRTSVDVGAAAATGEAAGVLRRAGPPFAASSLKGQDDDDAHHRRRR